MVCLLLFSKVSKYPCGIILNISQKTQSANVPLLGLKKRKEDLFINSFSVFSVLGFYSFKEGRLLPKTTCQISFGKLSVALSDLQRHEICTANTYSTTH